MEIAPARTKAPRYVYSDIAREGSGVGGTRVGRLLYTRRRTHTHTKTTHAATKLACFAVAAATSCALRILPSAVTNEFPFKRPRVSLFHFLSDYSKEIICESLIFMADTPTVDLIVIIVSTACY